MTTNRTRPIPIEDDSKPYTPGYMRGGDPLPLDPNLEIPDGTPKPAPDVPVNDDSQPFRAPYGTLPNYLPKAVPYISVAGQQAPVDQYNYTPDKNGEVYTMDPPGDAAPSDQVQVNAGKELSLDELRRLVTMLQRGPGPLVQDEAGNDAPNPAPQIDVADEMRNGERTSTPR